MNDIDVTPQRALGSGRGRLFAGYGPLLGIIVTFLLIVTLTPTIAPEALRTSGSGGPAIAGGVPPSPGGDGFPAADAGGDSRTSGTDPSGTSANPTDTSTNPSNTSTTDPGGAPAVAAVGACTDRSQQIESDPYSPPCVTFDGDNGGSTWRGVSEDTIRVSFRVPIEDIRDFQGLITELTAGAESDIPVPTEADVSRTIDGLLQYFSDNFEFYGRELELVEWQGQGSALNEILGAGQETANADAIKAANELDVFADVSAFTQPYNDALARQGVIALGAPYMSRQWFQDRAPFSYSPFPDCTSLGEMVASWGNARVFGYPATLADGRLANRDRKVGILAPDNPEYQQCVDAAVQIAESAGHEIHRYSYTLDLSTASDQANTLAAKLRSDEITTVILAADPLVPLLLSSRLTQQDYFPEWIVTGTALTDLDLIGQLYDPRQWANAFGISMVGEQQPHGSSFAYFAFKSIYPAAEPIVGVELLYYYFYILAIGVQMAGPDLNPDTFLAGLRAYPGGTGPAGTWAFPEGEFTPYRDAREIRWDPEGISVYNGKPGRYVSNGERYRAGSWPSGNATAGG